MRFNIIAIGCKMPAWVNAGFLEYAKRFTAPFVLNLIELPMPKRSATHPVSRCIKEESDAILAAIPKNAITIALDEKGETFNTIALSNQIRLLQHQTPGLNFLIGGPDGLSTDCLNKAQYKWSLSALTLPHPLVRILLVEQLYRAISLLNNHPYHRI